MDSMNKTWEILHERHITTFMIVRIILRYNIKDEIEIRY